MDISLVIPLFNEEESIQELIDWIERVMADHHYSFEVILVDDGSTDASWQKIEELKKDKSFIKGIKFQRNYGKAAGLQEGFSHAEGEVIITMDADLQDSPEEIPGLYKMINEEGFDLVSGWKKKRHDPFSKRFPSKIYNRLVRGVTGIKLHDFNCGLKAYRKNVIKSIDVYGDMHRYIPVIAKSSGFGNIGEKIVQHQARKYGTSKFGFGRARGMLDLLTIAFISRFGKKPMHLFGTFGTLMFLAGFIAAGWVGGQKLYYHFHGISAPLVTDTPYFYIALTAMIIGTQLFLAGFLAEMSIRANPDRNKYQIEKII